MNFTHAQKIADAVLYEGYLLYPYRASAIKNVHRFNFGALYPAAVDGENPSDMPTELHTECLVAGTAPSMEIRVRFLHLLSRQVRRFAQPLAELSADAELKSESVSALEIDGKHFATWDEATPREATFAVQIGAANPGPPGGRRTTLSHGRGSDLVDNRFRFSFPASQAIEPLRNQVGQFVGLIVRSQRAVEGLVEMTATPVEGDAFILSLSARNVTRAAAPLDSSDRPAALQCSLLATHALLGVEHGGFVSLLDPPEALRDAAAGCVNVGVWPVLAAEPPARDVLLVSPIILYDYPQVAPESAGDYFDGAEIDEMLALRIMTLTDDEKREMRDLDPRSRQLLERTEALSADELARLHGAVREFMVK